jgi:hypothetical protein
MEWIPKVEQKKYFCHHCKAEIVFDVKMQRADVCPHCAADLHCCKNCEYWEPSAHNQCREHVTEYISDRERANHCTSFTFRSGQPEDPSSRIAASKAKLDALFGGLSGGPGKRNKP